MNKLKKKIWSKTVAFFKNKKIYFYLYRSYWYFLLISKKSFDSSNLNYATALPNSGAGIGHQLANWIAGYWWANQLDLKFVHTPFTNHKWETFLGFGESNKGIDALMLEGYQKVRLPLFDKYTFPKINKIVNSYSHDSKICFVFEQDQFFEEQYPILLDLKNMFFNSVSRKLDNLQFSPDTFNIAVHVRRTVIIENKVINESDEVKAKRWLSNDYYENVLKCILENVKFNKPVCIWLFSTGRAEEFEGFKKYGQIKFCNDMDEFQTFSHLVFADLLITSKSSFSYKPALLNKGIKVCPKNFWHGYPDSKDWILCENNGEFNIDKLNNVFI